MRRIKLHEISTGGLERIQKKGATRGSGALKKGAALSSGAQTKPRAEGYFLWITMLPPPSTVVVSVPFGAPNWLS